VSNSPDLGHYRGFGEIYQGFADAQESPQSDSNSILSAFLGILDFSSHIRVEIRYPSNLTSSMTAARAANLAYQERKT
jgi:hypothetical protein